MDIELIDQRKRSCSSDIKSAVAFLKWILPFKTSDPGFQLLNFLLLGRQGFALRRYAIALLLELAHPATQRRFHHPKRASGFKP